MYRVTNTFQHGVKGIVNFLTGLQFAGRGPLPEDREDLLDDKNDGYCGEEYHKDNGKRKDAQQVQFDPPLTVE